MSFEGLSAVVLATPVETHAALAQAALDYGLDVLVEKPLALSVSDAERVLATAASQERILMVDHLVRYHPAMDALRAWVSDGSLGSLVDLTAQRLNLGVVRTRENAWWSLAPHDLSVLLDLVAEEPTEITARGVASLRRDRCDLVHADLRFPQGVTARLHVSWLDPVKVRRLTVIGTNGMAVLDGQLDPPLVRYAYRTEHAKGQTRLAGEVVERFAGDADEPLRRVAAAFLESIETRVPPMSDGRDGLRVVRILEAGQRSIDRGGEPVSMVSSSAPPGGGSA
jgi:UDP-2-acetamido-3-amino-2,3-dideoxy-glucuronate N-acetyltransferase